MYLVFFKYYCCYYLFVCVCLYITFCGRSKLQEEYCRQAESVLGQWETDIEKLKEQEEKLMVSQTLIFY
jgi:hypothetical protein